jgi:hypothetical protein
MEPSGISKRASARLEDESKVFSISVILSVFTEAMATPGSMGQP